MSIIFIRILLFGIIPIGVFILIKGIKLLRKSFYGQILLEITLSQKSGNFSITKAGNFSIWLKAPLLKRTLADKFIPVIKNTTTKENLKIHYSYSGIRANDFSVARMEIFTFSAPTGMYELQLMEGSSLSGLQQVVANLIPSDTKIIESSKQSIQIRETQPKIIVFLAIPIILLGSAGILGGFVLGLLADQLFK